MTSLRLTILGVLDRILKRLANAVATQLNSREPAFAEPPGRTDIQTTPPEHWLEIARPVPPEHWLNTVRQFAPTLLEAEGDGVIDSTADDAGLRDAMNPGVDTVWDDRPLAPPPRPSPAPRHEQRGRALRLVQVNALGSARRQEPGAAVISRPTAPARLHFHASALPADETASPPVRQGTGINTEPREVAIALAGERSVQPAADTDPPHRHRARHNAAQLPNAVASPLRRAGALTRLSLRLVRSTLRATRPPAQVHPARSAPPQLPAVPARDLTAVNLRISSHRFPALLDDERDDEPVNPYELQHRQKLDAEQGGQAWNA